MAIDDNEADGNLYKLFGKISTGSTLSTVTTVINYI